MPALFQTERNDKMKNILISCISKFNERAKEQGIFTYSNQDITTTAYQTNEACVKYLMSSLGKDVPLDVYIRVQSNDVAAAGDYTMRYLDGEIESFCGENGFAVPRYFDVFLREDEQYHRFDRVLSEISREIQRIAAEDPDITIHLDMAGGKRDNFIFIQLLTKLLSYYGYAIHAYYADADRSTRTGTIVNTDSSFRHMEVLDAVNDFVQHGSSAALRKAFSSTDCKPVKELLRTMDKLSDSIQLCATNLSEILNMLNEQLDEAEAEEDDSNGLFVIKVMIPLIRTKFHISPDSGSRSIIGIVRWCLENGLVQQALTIYNENVADIIADEKLYTIDMSIHNSRIQEMLKGHEYEKNSTYLVYILDRVYWNMKDSTDINSSELNSKLARYRSDSKRLRWTIAAIFFDEKYLPDGIRLNVPAEIMRKIFSDTRFAECIRNRVNHAMGTSTKGDSIVPLFNTSNYTFSTFPNNVTPNNVTKDMQRALGNLEAALDEKE